MKNPIQPLVEGHNGIIRFKANILVNALLEHGRKTGFSLNELVREYDSSEHSDDWEQLAQLIGYSLCGYSSLSYVTDASYDEAVEMSKIIKQKGNKVSKEAMKLALDALEESKTNNDSVGFHDRKNKAITSLQEALREQQEYLAKDAEEYGNKS